MGKYKVGKARNYQRYLYECLSTMYDAGVVYFTISELATWAGLPISSSMRRYCDTLALEGSLMVAPPVMVAPGAGRTYNLNSVAWFGVVLDA